MDIFLRKTVCKIRLEIKITVNFYNSLLKGPPNNETKNIATAAK